MSTNLPRYALYFVPAPDTALARFGESILGDAAAPSADGPARAGWLATTEEPRRYGFHATLKAPFHPADGQTLQSLSTALHAFAAERPPVPVGPLAVRRLGRFIALVPAEPTPALNGFAAEIVAGFEPFRAPLSAEDIQRRLAADLTRSQAALLARWGYPYVFAEYRFHMTLTGSLNGADLARWLDVLANAFADQADDRIVVDAIALLEQPDRGSRFRLIERVPLTGDNG
jgi:hypothetical protein